MKKYIQPWVILAFLFLAPGLHATEAESKALKLPPKITATDIEPWLSDGINVDAYGGRWRVHLNETLPPELVFLFSQRQYGEKVLRSVPGRFPVGWPASFLDPIGFKSLRVLSAFEACGEGFTYGGPVVPSMKIYQALESAEGLLTVSTARFTIKGKLEESLVTCAGESKNLPYQFIQAVEVGDWLVALIEEPKTYLDPTEGKRSIIALDSRCELRWPAIELGNFGGYEKRQRFHLNQKQSALYMPCFEEKGRAAIVEVSLDSGKSTKFTLDAPIHQTVSMGGVYLWILAAREKGKATFTIFDMQKRAFFKAPLVHQFDEQTGAKSFFVTYWTEAQTSILGLVTESMSIIKPFTHAVHILMIHQQVHEDSAAAAAS